MTYFSTKSVHSSDDRPKAEAARTELESRLLETLEWCRGRLLELRYLNLDQNPVRGSVDALSGEHDRF